MKAASAIRLATDPTMPRGDERDMLVDQDARLMAVILYEPTPGFVAQMAHTNCTFERDNRSDVCQKHGAIKKTNPKTERLWCPYCARETSRRFQNRNRRQLAEAD